MLRINSLVAGLLIPFCLSSSVTAATINTNLNKDLNSFLLSQLTEAGRQQEAFARDSYTLYRQIQDAEESRKRQQAHAEQVRRIASSFIIKRDYIGLGSLYYSNGYMRDAIDAYTMAIEANPKNSTIYFLRGRVRGDQYDLRGAIADYDIAIALNPASDGAYINRAVDKFRLKDKNGSLQDFRSAARIYRATGNTVDFEDTMRRIRNLFKVQE
jgi:tetratricopeptide (TPR) repeat protein